MKSEHQNLDDQGEIIDSDEVPLQYRVEGLTSTKSGPGSARDRVHSKNSPLPQRRNPSRQASQAAPVSDSPWFFRTIKELVSSSPKRPSSSHRVERKQKENVDTLLGIEGTPERDYHIDRAEDSQNQLVDLEHQFQDALHRKEHEWMVRENELERQIQLAKQSAVESNQMFQARIYDLQMEKSALEQQHNTLIRKQHLASIRQMESARWLPEDETKIMSDLSKLKMDMRSWAKTSSIKDASILQTLGEVEHTALMQELSNVVVLEHGQLPMGITTTAKWPMILLNALLTDHVYMSIFQSPFFFLGTNSENSSSTFRPEGTVEDMYSRAQNSNLQDAHIWRSQTLRLLKPPLRSDTSEGEKKLHHDTEKIIARVAQQQAMAFLASPTSFLIENSTKPVVVQKLKKIYDEAAKHSYMLWTRRTEMRCYTFRNLEQPVFDAESSFFDPDALMRYEDHNDQLKDRPVTVMVHPLVKVAGTDEAKDYDQERVWAKGVVWLDSKVT